MFNRVSTDSWVCDSGVRHLRKRSPGVMIMSQLIARLSFFSFARFQLNASTTSVLWSRSSNISSPSEEEEQAIRPINKREAPNQREPGSLFGRCTGFTTRSSLNIVHHSEIAELRCGANVQQFVQHTISSERTCCSLQVSSFNDLCISPNDSMFLAVGVDLFITPIVGNKWCLVLLTLSPNCHPLQPTMKRCSQCIIYAVQLSGIKQTSLTFPNVCDICVCILCRDYTSASNMILWDKTLLKNVTLSSLIQCPV